MLRCTARHHAYDAISDLELRILCAPLGNKLDQLSLPMAGYDLHGMQSGRSVRDVEAADFLQSAEHATRRQREPSGSFHPRRVICNLSAAPGHKQPCGRPAGECAAGHDNGLHARASALRHACAASICGCRANSTPACIICASCCAWRTAWCAGACAAGHACCARGRGGMAAHTGSLQRLHTCRADCARWLKLRTWPLGPTPRQQCRLRGGGHMHERHA
jgi:hypothetical protein